MCQPFGPATLDEELMAQLAQSERRRAFRRDDRRAAASARL